MSYDGKNVKVSSWREENERLSIGFGSVTDTTGKQVRSLIYDKRYQVYETPWSVLWGIGVFNMKNEMKLGDKLLFCSDEYKMSIDDFRVLIAMIKMCDIGNIFPYKQQILVEALKISRARVSKSIKKLLQYNALYSLKEFERDGFFINAEISYKGEIRNGDELSKLSLKEQAEQSILYTKIGIYTTKKRKNKNAHQGE